MDKILPIVSTALSALALVVGVIVLLQVNSLSTAMTAGVEATSTAVDPATIDISKLEEFAFDDNFVLTFDKDETNNAANVVFTMGFVIYNDTDDKEITAAATVARDALTNQGAIIRGRIETILLSKDVSYFTDMNKETELKKDILTMVQTLIGNEAIIDIYFNGLIVNEK